MDLYSQEIQEKKNDLQNQPQTIKKMAIGTYISIITLNVNELNAPTKDTDWLKVKVAQSCPALCDTMDYTVHGILQARILEYTGALLFSRRSSQPRN